jgi:hypothetical protein
MDKGYLLRDNLLRMPAHTLTDNIQAIKISRRTLGIGATFWFISRRTIGA